MTVELPTIVSEHIRAVNAGDVDAVVATFTDDALVNDARREFRGARQIRVWIAEEIVGDRVTMQPIEAAEHHGTTVLRASYDGDFDKSGLPDPVILTNYVTIRDGRIATLIVILNDPAPRVRGLLLAEVQG
ncbi:MAG TPA: nuclear transport factor 2 family protein [Acidimicrobiia bacterium]|jgi:hypothetical protein|nr:nuclear transport factor 2 family protein [Acidimicrobiia bacterium]